MWLRHIAKTKDYLSLSAPAILFACLLFSLTAPSYIWNIL